MPIEISRAEPPEVLTAAGDLAAVHATAFGAPGLYRRRGWRLLFAGLDDASDLYGATRVDLGRVRAL